MTEVLRRYLEWYRGRHVRLATLAVIGAANSFLSLGIAWLVQRLFDVELPTRSYARLLPAGAAILVLSLAANALLFWVRRQTMELTKSVIFGLRLEVLNRLYRWPRSFFDAKDRSLLHSSIVQDTERIDVMTNALLAQLLPAALAGVVLFTYLLNISVVLSLVLAGIAPVAALFTRYLSRRLRLTVNRFRTDFDEYSRGVRHLLEAMDLTRLKSAQAIELGRQETLLGRLRDSGIAIGMMDTAYNLLLGMFSLVSTLVVLIVGGKLVLENQLTIGSLMAFFVTMRLVALQYSAVLSLAPQVVSGVESLKTITRLLEAPPLEQARTGARIEFQGGIELQDVHFGYRDGVPVLRDTSLAFEPGAVNLISGPNGSGKSTLLWLVCGFYSPQQGRLLADGVPYEDLDLDHLRRFFGVVPQEPYFFPGTIRENAAYGAPEAAAEQIEEALRVSTAAAVLENLPDGLDTRMGDDGGLLSGGQRQRIAIARALLGCPRLLILDEPANHLDPATVDQLVRNLRALPYCPTVILVSHDRRFAQVADKVFRMEAGRAVAAAPAPTP